MVGTTTSKTVTIEKRGAFHDDSFFKDSWDTWDKAMQDVVTKWDQESPLSLTQTSEPQGGSETRSVYRKIRSSNVTSDDSQAVSCTEEDDKFKVVIDVKDFKPEDINVKTVDDTVVVEGKVEKKEGYTISTQKFVRRFLLPPGINLNAISSALSKDGVLTINAPKLQVTKPAITNGRSVPVHRDVVSSKKLSSSTNVHAAGKPSFQDSTDKATRANTTTTYLMREKSPKRSQINMPPAGKPSYSPSTSVYSTTATVGSSHSPRSSFSDVGKPISRVTETFNISVPEKISTGAPDNHWGKFNDMVERSQKEMDEMMRRHTLHTSLEPPQSLPKTLNQQVTSRSNIMAVPSNGVHTTRDVVKDGNKVIEREEHRWDDNPTPGLSRTNRARAEVSTVKNAAGEVIGLSDKKQQHSHAEGSHEETLPDGTKVRSFTKNYETKNLYSVNSNGAKAL